MSELKYSPEFELGVKSIDKEGQFEAHASVFNNTDKQHDIVMPSAFAGTLKRHGGKVPILMAHQMARIIGFGIDAAEDAKGLWVKGEFTLDSDDGRNAYATAKHAAALGHKLGMSIGYMVPEGGSEYDEAKGVRRLHKIDLLEYSIAAVAANDRATMLRVKAASGSWTERDFEEYLREGGLSREAAKAFVSRGFSALSGSDQRDADADDEAFRKQLRDQCARGRGTALVNSFREVRKCLLQQR